MCLCHTDFTSAYYTGGKQWNELQKGSNSSSGNFQDRSKGQKL